MKDRDELMRQAEEMQNKLFSSMTEEQKQAFEKAEKMMSEMMGVSDMTEFMNLSAKEQKKRANEMNGKMLDMMGMTKEDAIRANREMRKQDRRMKKSFLKASEEDKNSLRPFVKNVIYVKTDVGTQLETASSKIGGKPDLPDGFEWFVNGQGEPLSFLMQINLREIHVCDREKTFPESGMLYFFYDIENQPWSSSDDISGYSVYFYGGDTSALAPTDFPVKKEEEYANWGIAQENRIIDETSVSFFCKNDLPSYEDYCNMCGGSCMTCDSYEAATEELLGYSRDEYAQEYFKLSGYANAIQSGLTEEFDEEYVQLCQFTTYESEKYGVMFGDGGNLNYFIKKSDLEKSRFDRTEISLQCY